MTRPRSIVLLSAGLDSAVNLQLAHRQTDIALALTFDYGQLAAQREIAAARAMCRRIRVRHQVVRLPWLRQVSHSALTRDEKAIPWPSRRELDAGTARDRARVVWVPNRNGLFINIAACFAEALDCDLVVAGFNAEEAATFADNSPQFVRAANRALHFSTLRRPRVVSYTQDLGKAKIVRLGREIGAPLDMIWSCYRGGSKHCWRCESCLRLRRALGAARAWSWFRQQRCR